MGITKQYMLDEQQTNYCDREFDIDDLAIGDLEDGVRPGATCGQEVYFADEDKNPWSSSPTRRVCTTHRCEQHCDDVKCPVHDGDGCFREESAAVNV
jgi:hypothetical protein